MYATYDSQAALGHLSRPLRSLHPLDFIAPVLALRCLLKWAKIGTCSTPGLPRRVLQIESFFHPFCDHSERLVDVRGGYLPHVSAVNLWNAIRGVAASFLLTRMGYDFAGSFLLNRRGYVKAG